MYVVEYYVKDAINRIDNMVKYKDKKNFNPKNYETTYVNIMLNLYNVFAEMTYLTRYNSYILNRIGRMIEKKDKFLRDKEEFVDELEYLVADLKAMDLSYIRYYDYYDDYSISIDNQKNISNYRYLEMISTITLPNNRPLKILDIEAHTSKALETIKNSYKDEVECYGISKKELYCDIDRYITNSNNNRIYVSNNTFDVLIHSPAISTESSTRSLIFRKYEKETIKDSIKYLRPDGAYFLIIPGFRLYSDIINILSKQLYDIKIYPLEECNHYSNHYPVVIRGIKRKERLSQIDEESYSLLKTCFFNLNNKKNSKSVPEKIDFPLYKMPQPEIEVKYFRGTNVTDTDMKNIISKSDCIEQVFNYQEKVETSYDKIPLLPFTLGQIGLVLSSGCVDGLVDEQNGYYHLIKGRIVKEKNSEDAIENNVVYKDTTTRNRVEINTLFPDGTCKQLI